jgi:hypothetical protein
MVGAFHHLKWVYEESDGLSYRASSVVGNFERENARGLQNTSTIPIDIASRI